MALSNPAYPAMTAYWPTQPKAKTAPDFFGRTPEAADVLNPVSLPKVPGADPQIKGLFEQAQAAYQRSQEDLNRYRSMFGTLQPKLNQFNAQESGAIGSWYDPNGVQSQMAGIRSRQQAAQGNLSQQLLLDLHRALGLGSVGRGPQGLGSYLTRMVAAEAGKIRNAEAVNAAGAERSDLAALLALQAQGLGRRQAAELGTLQGQLAPITAESAVQSNYSALLQQALNAALANLTQSYGMQQMGY